MKTESGKSTATESLTLCLNLPDELIPQILQRLPVKSLVRFKSVSKPWQSLISDPKFAKSHFDLAAVTPTHRSLVRKINHSPEIDSLDIDSPSISHKSSLVNLKLPLPSIKRNIGFHQNPIYIFGSCRGIVALAFKKGDVVLWNPATGFQKRIGGGGLGVVADNILNGFGYDPKTDDYLTVSIRLIDSEYDFEYLFEKIDNSRCFISYYSVRTNSWVKLEDTNVYTIDRRHGDVSGFDSKIECFLHGSHYTDDFYTINRQHRDVSGFDPRIGCFLHESVHWLVVSFDTKFHVIISFNLVERSFLEITLPHALATRLSLIRYHLRVMGKCLSLCYPGDKYSNAEIWVMKEYKVQSSWTKLFAFSTCEILYNVFFPKCLTKHGGIFGTNDIGTLIIVNDKGNLLDGYALSCNLIKHQDIQGYFCMYEESLLSLPS